MANIWSWIVKSSADPTQVSRTITSLGKVLIGIIPIAAILFHVDPAVLAGQAQGVIDNAVALVAAGYSTFYACEAFYFAIAKVINTLKNPTTTP